ncbi:MAG: TetR/AcrR family transcriptional regulator [Ferrimicrobium sp.]
MSSSTTAHDRLLDAATELFYSEGITATGVDKIAAFSGVSKQTLYAHFHSKDQLVAAVLERRRSERVVSLDAWVSSHASTPLDRLLAVFDWLGEWHSTEGRRGCAFVNAAAELPDPTHPAREVASRRKREMRYYLAKLADEAGLREPERVGSDLMLLLDGANARMVVENDRGAAKDARRLASVLIDAQEKGEG